jgi:UDP-N-acetylmuramoyl-tripeptide--D-alanyl-D-alanine ligase
MNREPLWSAEDAARATGGRHHAGPWIASGVAIDSRTLKPGDLFVAIAGPRFDGHDFVGQALSAGAAAAVVGRVPDGLAPEAPLLLVDDPLAALQRLGRAARARSRARIVGVTGSVGKTGIKEALKAVLAPQGVTHASEGSLNNHWGVPLSLARLPAEARFAVFEMGMNHAGELTDLTAQVRPQVAVITTIAPAHLGNFPSVDAIADAKAEIFAGIAEDGIAVLNRDNAYFARLATAARARGIRTILSFGRAPGADVRLLDAILDADGADVRAEVSGTACAYRLNLPGEHWVDNSLCVLAACTAVGADLPAAAAVLATIAPPRGRGQRLPVRLAGGALTVIDDSYNASPHSMLAAIAVIGRMQPSAAGRRLAVLGDMLELGEQSRPAHVALSGPLQERGVDQVFTAGPAMAELFAALPRPLQGAQAADADALAPLVTAAVRPGDIVLVKGSAGSRMGVVVKALLALDAGAAAAQANGR